MKDKICGTCSLYKLKEGVCGVNIIKNGEVFELTTKPEDYCFWLKNGIEVDQISVDYKGSNRIITD